jgi:hypothetical protein
VTVRAQDPEVHHKERTDAQKEKRSDQPARPSFALATNDGDARRIGGSEDDCNDGGDRIE